MSTSYFMSDLHDGHKAIGKYRQPITASVVCVESNRQYIRDNWRAKKNDKVYMLGDVCFAKDSHKFIKSLSGHKDLILGNHDLENKSRSTLPQLQEAFNKIQGMRSKSFGGQSYWLSHCPLHPQQLRGKMNLHGHIHNKEEDFMNDNEDYDGRFVNVNMDVLIPRTGFIMLTVEEMLEYAQTKHK